jgi:hypothetical protein
VSVSFATGSPGESMRPDPNPLKLAVLAKLLEFLPIALAHDHVVPGSTHASDSNGVPSNMSIIQMHNATTMRVESYFSHSGFAGVMYAHIALMTIAWVFLLPLCT